MMTATTAAWEAARFLSTLDEAPTLRGVVTMDPLSYDGTKLRLVARDPQCPMCRDWHYREERTA
jgi:hypothetical protein